MFRIKESSAQFFSWSGGQLGNHCLWLLWWGTYRPLAEWESPNLSGRRPEPLTGSTFANRRISSSCGESMGASLHTSQASRSQRNKGQEREGSRDLKLCWVLPESYLFCRISWASPATVGDNYNTNLTSTMGGPLSLLTLRRQMGTNSRKMAFPV